MNRLLLLFAVLSLPLAGSAQILRTTVEQGEIEGEMYNGVAMYRAIPYAEAPVGDLRWKAPVEKKPWQGVLKAERFGSRPPQPEDASSFNNEIPMGEDCLYLLIETAAKSKDERQPVIVRIHGGGFQTGTYAETQECYPKSGVIFVSVEYRMGALGFMPHPELSKESPNGVSGNYGILDQIMALRWIKKNIAAFGGDPEKITILGESAGGMSVSILCGSPLCKGLFRSAICESGGFFMPVTNDPSEPNAVCSLKAGEQKGLKMQKALGAKNIKAMRKLPYKKILEASNAVRFSPIADGYVIPGDQYRMYEAGKYNDVNILLGSNSDEGAMWGKPASVESYKEFARTTYGEWADRLLEAYPAKSEQDVYFSRSDIMRDCSFAWATYSWGNLQSRTGKSPVYMYYFDQDCENCLFRSKRGGATHCGEMAFAYDKHFNSYRMNEKEMRMHQIIYNYWVNFAKTGNPNGEFMPYWPVYEPGKPSVMIMHEGFVIGPVQNQKQIDFFDSYFRSKREKE